jgi:hypothetical protein
MRIFYIGHPAHAWSASTVFFENALSKNAQLIIHRPNAFDAPEILQQGLDEEFDLYVFFQFDFMAYPFIAAGKRVLIIPMVDGSATYGVNHWRYLSDASFLSFSKTLTSYLRRYSKSVYEAQYFPEPEPYVLPTEASVYYWPREENFEPYLLRAVRFLPDDVEKLTIRLGPTEKISDVTRMKIERKLNLEVVEIENRSSHINQIRRSSGVIASRRAEGIGHSFLEAMSLGRFVVASNYPTMNEYIRNGHNGFITKTRVTAFPLTAVQLGTNALKDVMEGRQKYLLFEADLGLILDRASNSPCFSRGDVARNFERAIAIYRGQSFPKGFGVNLDTYIRLFGR